LANAANIQVIAEVRQSEEGGRFFRDTNLYQIAILDRGSPELPPDCRALSLREVEWLAPRNVFTNEARSVLSLILAYC
jgi:oxidase EvaA